MSRCFPFPPPNYREEERILTESIKLQKEQDASKEKRKERKREKKERREKSRDRNENSEDLERSHKKQKGNEAIELCLKDACQIVATKKIELHNKDVATEQLERSGLTEEHGLQCLAAEPCESSQSTQTSSKGRKFETISQQGVTIMRFTLPLQKCKGSKPTVIISEEPRFSGRVISEDPEPASRKVDEPCFSGRVTEAPTEMQLGESRNRKRRRGNERKFRNLIMKWKLAPFHLGDSIEDLGWLLDNSQHNRASSEAKSCSSGKDMSYGSSTACSFQPRAYHLPEWETYQLPYVIPF